MKQDEGILLAATLRLQVEIEENDRLQRVIDQHESNAKFLKDRISSLEKEVNKLKTENEILMDLNGKFLMDDRKPGQSDVLQFRTNGVDFYAKGAMTEMERRVPPPSFYGDMHGTIGAIAAQIRNREPETITLTFTVHELVRGNI